MVKIFNLQMKNYGNSLTKIIFCPWKKPCANIKYVNLMITAKWSMNLWHYYGHMNCIIIHQCGWITLWLRPFYNATSLIECCGYKFQWKNLKASPHVCVTLLGPVHISGSARRSNTVPITRSNTQGGKGSGGHERLSGNTASEARDNLNRW